MLKLLGLALCVPLVVCLSLSRLGSLTPIVVPAKYDTLYEESIDYSIEHVFVYNEGCAAGERITVASNATESEPLIVVVRQNNAILSWQIPFVVKGKNSDAISFSSTSRALCLVGNDGNSTEFGEQYVTVSISTWSAGAISYSMNITHRDFDIGNAKNVTISPAEPIYFGYNFSGEADASSVVVRLESHSDICMTMSIQNPTCPVFDLERNVQYSGSWQTVMRQGAITIPRESYPHGFFVVLVVKSDDRDCYGSIGPPDRRKVVSLFVQPTISKNDVLAISAAAFAVGFGFCTIYVIGVIAQRVRRGGQSLLRSPSSVEEGESSNRTSVESVGTQEEDPKPPSSVEEGESSNQPLVESVGTQEEDEGVFHDAQNDNEILPKRVLVVSDLAQTPEEDEDVFHDAQDDNELLPERVLVVSDLARKEPTILRRESRLYLYYLITIAVFYALPATQLVITYQKSFHVTGNQDLCYYNFLCAHPLGFSSDFNHVFSNFGYLLLGLLFIFLIYIRENYDQERINGIPQHYGLFYAMGTAMMMQGILSASYHACPSYSNFQIDTSFMYIMSVLCLVKIYQNRHPDVNARASVTFGVLALIIFFGMVGVLDGTRAFWVIFTFAHLILCIVLTWHIYNMGRFRMNRGTLQQIIMNLRPNARTRNFTVFKPLYGGRLVILLIANAWNVGLLVYGCIMHEDKDFPTFLLAVLVSNVVLYVLFYIAMKLLHRERILFEPACYIILSFVTWIVALYFFNNKPIAWDLTPAQSRINNQPCALLNFFDSHDIWHFLSAIAMFFSFMVLLTLDDDLSDTPRSQIPVF